MARPSSTLTFIGLLGDRLSTAAQRGTHGRHAAGGVSPSASATAQSWFKAASCISSGLELQSRHANLFRHLLLEAAF